MMEIARTSGVPYPTACRIVQTLMYEGLIEREPSRKRYRPTALVQTLSHGFQGHGLLVQVARPHIVELTRKLVWPISLVTHVGHSMVIRDSTHALTALTFNSYFPGFTLPILESAAGIAYIGYLPEDERKQLLTTLKLLASKMTTHMIDLFENSNLADKVRAQGYVTRAYNVFTSNPGMTSSIAVPILVGERPVGALTLAFFASSMKMSDAVEQFAQPLKDAARSIATDLSSANFDRSSIEI